MRILGIDPGLAVTGFGILEIDGDKVKLLNAGTFSTSKGMLSERLKSIFVRISDLLDTDSPAEVAIEEGFYGKNVKVAMSLGQARGAVLLACSLNRCTDLRIFTARGEASGRRQRGSIEGASQLHD